MRKNAFTLIELITVIVLLGILAASALPRFVDFREDAELSKFKAFYGALSSAVTQMHMKWQIEGKPYYVLNNDVAVGMSSTGFPEAECVSYPTPSEYQCHGNALVNQDHTSVWACKDLVDWLIEEPPVVEDNCSGSCDYEVDSYNIAPSPKNKTVECHYIIDQGNGSATIKYHTITGAVTLVE